MPNTYPGDFVQLPSGDLAKCLNCFSAKTECTFSEEVKVFRFPIPSYLSSYGRSRVQILRGEVAFLPLGCDLTYAVREVRDLEEKVQRAEELLARVCRPVPSP